MHLECQTLCFEHELHKVLHRSIFMTKKSVNKTQGNLKDYSKEN